MFGKLGKCSECTESALGKLGRSKGKTIVGGAAGNAKSLSAAQIGRGCRVACVGFIVASLLGDLSQYLPWQLSKRNFGASLGVFVGRK